MITMYGIIVHHSSSELNRTLQPTVEKSLSTDEIIHKSCFTTTPSLPRSVYHLEAHSTISFSSTPACRQRCNKEHIRSASFMPSPRTSRYEKPTVNKTPSLKYTVQTSMIVVVLAGFLKYC